MKPRRPQPAPSSPGGEPVHEAAAADRTPSSAASVRSLFDRAMTRTARHDPRALERYLAVLAAAPRSA